MFCLNNPAVLFLSVALWMICLMLMSKLHLSQKCTQGLQIKEMQWVKVIELISVDPFQWEIVVLAVMKENIWLRTQNPK